MKKIIIPSIFLLLILSINALSIDNMCGETVEPNTVCNMVTPYLLCTGDYNYSVYNKTGFISGGNLTEMVNYTQIYYFEFNQSKGDYIVKLCDESTREIKVKNMENGESIAISMFILLITGGVLFLAIWGRFSRTNELLNNMLKRVCYTLVCFSLMLDAAIMSTIVTSSGLNLTQEMFFVMWIFGTLGFIMMGYTVLKSLLDVLQYYKIKKNNKRMGNNGY